MDLIEAKDYLNKNGFILEDTETDDDEYDALTDKMEKDPTWWKNDISNSLRNKLKKRSKLYNKHANLEDKTLHAVNYNMRNFVKGVLKGLIEADYTMVSRDILDYDDKENYQLIRYHFTNNRKGYFLEVKYYDEDGSIKMKLLDDDYIEIENYDFSITTIDKAIDVVLDFVAYNLK